MFLVPNNSSILLALIFNCDLQRYNYTNSLTLLYLGNIMIPKLYLIFLFPTVANIKLAQRKKYTIKSIKYKSK